MSERSNKAYHETRIAIIKKGLEMMPDAVRKILPKELARELAQGKINDETLRKHPRVQPMLRPLLMQVDKVAHAVRETIEEQENNATWLSGGTLTWEQIWRAFSKNPGEFISGFFTALLEGIIGLFQGNGLAGFSDAFKRNLGPLVAPEVAQDMGASLRDKLDTRGIPDFMTNQIVPMFQNQIMVQGGAQPIFAPPPAASGTAGVNGNPAPNNPAQPMPQIAGNTPEERLTSLFTQLSSGFTNNPLLANIPEAKNLQPALIKMGVKVTLDNNALLEQDKYDELAVKYVDALWQNNNAKEQLKTLATNLGIPVSSDDELKPLIAGLLANQLKPFGPVLKAAINGSVVNIPVPAPAASTNVTSLLPKHTVKQQIVNLLGPQALDGIENQIIAQVVDQKKQLDNDKNPKFPLIHSRLRKKLGELLKDKDKDEGRAVILSFAAHMGGPNQKQREAMAKEIADAASEILLHEQNAKKSLHDLAPQIAAAVEKKLGDKHDEIEKLNPNGKFKLSDKDIEKAAKEVKEQIEKMTPQQQKRAAMAQALVDHKQDAVRKPLVFDIKYAEARVKSMAAVVSREEMGKAVYEEVKEILEEEFPKAMRAKADKKGYQNYTLEELKDNGGIPNDKQSERMIHLTAAAIRDVMTNENIPQNEKATVIRGRVIEYLWAGKTVINTRQDDGSGLANNSKNFLWWDHGIYNGRFELTGEKIIEIADVAASRARGMLSMRSDLTQLPPLTSEIKIEAPRLPAPAAGAQTRPEAQPAAR